MKESERWELVALIRALWPNQTLDDETVERWSRTLDRWELPVAQLALSRLAETVERWRGLATFVDAYWETWRELHPNSPIQDERSPDERRAAIELRDRWERVHRAMVAMPDVRRFVQEHIGGPWDGYRGRRRAVESLAEHGASREPTFAPGESDRLLEQIELLIGERPVPTRAAPLETRDDEWWQRYQEIKRNAEKREPRKRRSGAAVLGLGS